MRRLVVTALVFAIFSFFLYRLQQTASEETLRLLSFDWTIIILSLIPLTIGFALIATAWWTSLKSLGADSTLKEAYRIFAITHLGKYLPGSIWPIIGRTALLKSKKSNSLIASTIHMILNVLAALLMALIFLTEALKEYIHPSLVLIVIVTIMIILYPRVLLTVITKVNRIFKRSDKRMQEINYLWTITTLVVLVTSWILIGSGFILFINAFVSAPYLSLIGAFSLAWAIGFLALFVPAGVGVREGVLVILLMVHFTESIAIALTIAARIWWMVGDMILFITGWFYDTSSQKH